MKEAWEAKPKRDRMNETSQRIQMDKEDSVLRCINSETQILEHYRSICSSKEDMFPKLEKGIKEQKELNEEKIKDLTSSKREKYDDSKVDFWMLRMVLVRILQTDIRSEDELVECINHELEELNAVEDELL